MIYLTVVLVPVLFGKRADSRENMAENEAETNHEILTITDHVNHLRKWVQQQQPTLNSLETDEFLLRFLRVSDFRFENAKLWLVNYWRYRTENSQW